MFDLQSFIKMKLEERNFKKGENIDIYDIIVKNAVEYITDRGIEITPDIVNKLITCGEDIFVTRLQDDILFSIGFSKNEKFNICVQRIDMDSYEYYKNALEKDDMDLIDLQDYVYEYEQICFDTSSDEKDSDNLRVKIYRATDNNGLVSGVVDFKTGESKFDLYNSETSASILSIYLYLNNLDDSYILEPYGVLPDRVIKSDVANDFNVIESLNDAIMSVGKAKSIHK